MKRLNRTAASRDAEPFPNEEIVDEIHIASNGLWTERSRYGISIKGDVYSLGVIMAFAYLNEPDFRVAFDKAAGILWTDWAEEAEVYPPWDSDAEEEEGTEDTNVLE